MRAVLDEFDVSFVCGSHASTGSDGHLALDAVCRADFGGAASSSPGDRPAAWPSTPASRSSWAAPRPSSPTCCASAAAFPPEVRRFGIVVDPEGTSRVTETGGLPVLHLAAKEDLGGLLRWSVR